MNECAERIHTLIKQRNVSYGELSKKTGIPKSALQRYATGDTAKIPIERAMLIAKVLGSTPEFIMGLPENPTSAKKHPLKIPVYSRVFPEKESFSDIIDYEELDEATAKSGEYLALRVSGSGMAPRILDGDVVVIRRQCSAENGAVVAVFIGNSAAVIARYQKLREGIMLQFFNGSFEPLYYSAEEIASVPVTLLGRVTELRGKF